MSQPSEAVLKAHNDLLDAYKHLEAVAGVTILAVQVIDDSLVIHAEVEDDGVDQFLVTLGQGTKH